MGLLTYQVFKSVVDFPLVNNVALILNNVIAKLVEVKKMLDDHYALDL